MTRRLTPPLALILAASLAGCSAQVEQAASADFMPIFPLAADYQPGGLPVGAIYNPDQ